MDRKNEIIISKIIGYIDKIENYTKGSSKESFLSNMQLVEACVFNLLQIGELASRIDEQYRTKNQNVPWNKIRGLRNRLVHDYDGVNLELIGEIVCKDLAELKVLLSDSFSQ